MKILHTVESYYPSRGGMVEVVKQLSERLVKMGHEVTVATSKDPKRKSDIINGVKIVDFEIQGTYATSMHGEINEYRFFLLNSNFDIITNFAAQQWATDIMLPIMDKIKAKKINSPTGFSGLYVPVFKDYFEHMKVWMKKYDLNIFLSNDYRDINFARKNGITNNILIPNGASEEEFEIRKMIDVRRKLDINKNSFLILHVGSHTDAKGHKEAIQIFKKSKIRNSTFLIVGNKMLHHGSRNIFFGILRKLFFLVTGYGLGCYMQCKRSEFIYNNSFASLINKKKLKIKILSREETVAAYQQSDLFLLPSNIECSPIVLFECMASKTPFLVTDVGNSKEIMNWSNSGILLPTTYDCKNYSHANIKASAKILEKIFKDPNKRSELTDEGYKSWKKKFTWEKIAKEYETAYLRLLNKGD